MNECASIESVKGMLQREAKRDGAHWRRLKRKGIQRGPGTRRLGARGGNDKEEDNGYP